MSGLIEQSTEDELSQAIRTWRRVWISYACDEAKKNKRTVLPKYSRLSNRMSETDQIIALGKALDEDDLFLFGARTWAWMDRIYSRRFDDKTTWQAFRAVLMAALTNRVEGEGGAL